VYSVTPVDIVQWVNILVVVHQVTNFRYTHGKDASGKFTQDYSADKSRHNSANF